MGGFNPPQYLYITGFYSFKEKNQLKNIFSTRLEEEDFSIYGKIHIKKVENVQLRE